MKSSSPFTYGLLRNHTRHRGARDLTIIPMLEKRERALYTLAVS